MSKELFNDPELPVTPEQFIFSHYFIEMLEEIQRRTSIDMDDPQILIYTTTQLGILLGTLVEGQKIKEDHLEFAIQALTEGIRESTSLAEPLRKFIQKWNALRAKEKASEEVSNAVH